MGSLREKLGEDLNLIDKEAFKFGWITDFPLFEEDIQGNLSPSHILLLLLKEGSKN